MSKSPRLLLCTFDVVPGTSGSSRRLAETLDALVEHFTPEVLAVKGPDQAHIERFHGARLLRVPVGQGGLPARAEAFERAVRRQLESDEYAAVQFSDPFGGYALCEAREERNLRVVYEALRFPSHELRELHPELELDRKFLSRVRRRELYCLMNADRVLTGSHVTRTFVQSLGVNAERVEVVPTPVDVGSITAPATGLSERVRCVYVGDAARWQGLETLFRGLALASAEVDVHLDLVGPREPGPDEPLGKLIEDLGIGDLLTFRGPVPQQDVPLLVAAADVAMLPLADCERNRLQGTPLDRLSDYLATGRPVIASDLPLTRERLPGGCALFHPPGDAAALCTALLQLARDPRKREELSRRARTEAVRSLDVLRYRARLLRLYGELLVNVTPSGAGRSTEPSDLADPDERTSSLELPLEDAASRPQAVPRSRLRASSKVEGRQETRVARLADLKPPEIPAVAPGEALPAAPPSASLQVLSALPSLLADISDTLAEAPTAQVHLPLTTHPELPAAVALPPPLAPPVKRPPPAPELPATARAPGAPGPTSGTGSAPASTGSASATEGSAPAPAGVAPVTSGLAPATAGSAAATAGAAPATTGAAPVTAGSAAATAGAAPPSSGPRIGGGTSTSVPALSRPSSEAPQSAVPPAVERRTSASIQEPQAAAAGPGTLPPPLANVGIGSSAPRETGVSDGAAARPAPRTMTPARGSSLSNTPPAGNVLPPPLPTGASPAPPRSAPPSSNGQPVATAQPRIGGGSQTSTGVPRVTLTSPVPAAAPPPGGHLAPPAETAFPSASGPAASAPETAGGSPRPVSPPPLPSASASVSEPPAAVATPPPVSRPPPLPDVRPATETIDRVASVGAPSGREAVAPGPGVESSEPPLVDATELEEVPEPIIRSALEDLDDELLPGSDDPWLLQVLQGYCAPANKKSFDRHAPPTTFPGRSQAGSPAPQASPKVG